MAAEMLDMKPTKRVMEVRETMATLKRVVAAGVVVLSAASASVAQVSQAEADQIHLRQQIATMEIILQQAISHGAENVYAQFRSVLPDRPRLGPSRVGGFTIPKYGPVFTVDVPMIQLPILWEVMVRDAQYRSATMELQRMKNQAAGMAAGPERDRLSQAIFQLEQQLGVGNLRGTEVGRGGPNAPSLVPAGLAGVTEKVVEDPESAYTREVKAALIDAMLLNSQGLTIGSDEWLTIVARDAVGSNPQAPGDSVDSSKWLIRVKGSVIAAFQSKTISKDEARKLVEIEEQ
jgi:hypothetical protein